jgi:hypothetical protein
MGNGNPTSPTHALSDVQITWLQTNRAMSGASGATSTALAPTASGSQSSAPITSVSDEKQDHDASDEPPSKAAVAAWVAAHQTDHNDSSSPIDMYKPKLFIQSDRLAELDEAVSSGLLDRMQEAGRQARLMQAIAAAHGVDLNNPNAALATLRKAAAGALDKKDQWDLKQALTLLNTTKSALNDALINLRSESMTLWRSLEARRNATKPLEAQIEDYEPENDDAEHSYDGGVQILKFLSELPDAIDTVGKTMLEIVGGRVSTALELVGLDLFKDKVKGGNTDDLLPSLKTAVDELQNKVNDIIVQWKRNAASTADDALTNLKSWLRAMPEHQDNFVDAANQFDEKLKADIAEVMAAHAGKRPSASEDIKGIMAVNQAVLDAAEAGQEALIAISQQQTFLKDLPYWASVLVPLGKREHDGHVMSGEANEYMVYVNDSGERIAFILPSGGLKSSLEDLSGAIERIRKVYPASSRESDEIEKLHHRWMKAMVDAL